VILTPGHQSHYTIPEQTISYIIFEIRTTMRASKREEAPWERLHREGLSKFFGEIFAGDYEAGLIAEFDKLLPEKPPWKLLLLFRRLTKAHCVSRTTSLFSILALLI
jgi:hypothetical protein